MTLLKEQIVTIPLTGGLNTKVSEKLLEPGSNLELENVYMDKTGEIHKRNGYSNLTKVTQMVSTSIDDGTLDSANSLHSYKDQLVLIGSDTASTSQTVHGPHIWVKTDNSNKWVAAGHYQPCTFETKRLSTSRQDYCNPSIVEGNGLQVITYQCGSVPYFDLIDAETGIKYKERQSIEAGGYAPKAVYIEDRYGKHFLVLAYDPGDKLAGRIIDAEDPGSITSITVSTQVHATDILWDIDAVEYPAHYDDAEGDLDAYQEAIIVWKNDGGYISRDALTGLGVSHTYSQIEDTPKNCLAIKYVEDPEQGGRIFIVYQAHSDGAIDGYAYDPIFTAAQTRAAKVEITSAHPAENVKQITLASDTCYSGNNLSIFIEVEGDAEHKTYTKHIYTDFLLAPDSPFRTAYHVGLASKAFTYNNQAYVLLTHHSYGQSTYFLGCVRDSGSDWVYPAKIFYGIGGGLNTYNGLSNVIQYGTNQFKVCALRQSRFISGTIRDKQLASILFNLEPEPLPSVRTGESMLIGGGIITCFDGKSQEHSFHLYPENISVEYPAGSVAGGVGDGYRSFVAVYSYIDRNGELQRSAPSEAYGITFDRGTDTQSGTVNVPYLNQQDKDNKSAYGKVEIYRTIAGGTTYYLEIAQDSPNSAISDDLNATNSTDTADHIHESHEILYTESGEPPNIGPPGAVIIAARTDRVFLVPMDDPTAIWYSKPKVAGLGIEFSDEMVMRIDVDGPNTGLACMDDQVIIFKESSIYAVAGYGPNTLNQDSFSTVRPIATDVGCINQNSIVTMSQGVVFQSKKGIFLLDRSLQTTYIGAPVEYYNEYEIKKTVIVENHNQVRFILKDNNTMLVWDYYHNQWSTWTNHSAQDTIMHGDDFYYVTSAGQVKKQNATYLDCGHIVGFSVRTPWIKMAGIQGFQRIKHALVLGEYRSAHNLVVKVYTNFDDYTVQQTATYNTKTNHVLGEPLQYDIHLKKQKCQAMMFEIYDDNQSGTMESARLNAISLEVGIKEGKVKLPNRNKL